MLADTGLLQDDLSWVIVPSEPNDGLQITFTMYQMEFEVSG
jgi:hypothetical protein